MDKLFLLVQPSVTVDSQFSEGVPEIFNTEQDSQFTTRDRTDRPNASGTQVSMDGWGRWLVNVFMERLWRSLKQECVYPNAFNSVRACRAGISA